MWCVRFRAGTLLVGKWSGATPTRCTGRAAQRKVCDRKLITTEVASALDWSSADAGVRVPAQDAASWFSPIGAVTKWNRGPLKGERHPAGTPAPQSAAPLPKPRASSTPPTPHPPKDRNKVIPYQRSRPTRK
jgi:hypothetical protein